MKIAIDISSLSFSEGGIQHYIKSFIENFEKVYSEHFLILTSKLRKFFSLWRAGHPVRPFTGKIDILYGPDGYIPRRIKARLKSIMIHDVLYLEGSPFASQKSRSKYLKRLKKLKNVDVVITPSKFSKNKIIQYLNFDENRVFVVYHGIDEIFRPYTEEEIISFKKKKGLPNNFILWVGFLHRRKNLSGLIRALDLIKRKISLVVVGDVAYGGEEILPQLKGRKDIMWLKKQPLDEMPLFYNSASIFVLPSFGEGFGFPVLEAMACGTPCIISKNTALIEVGGDAVLYCNPEDPESIKEAIENLLQNSSLLKEFSLKGIKRAEEFKWERCVKQTFNIWENFLG